MTASATRRALLAGLGAGFAAPKAARAQIMRGKTIRIIVPFAAGGTSDVVARILADKLARLWDAAIVIENKPGAGGNIGAEQAARAAPDGATLLLTSPSLAANQFLYKSMRFDPQADFAPVCLLAVVPNILIVGNHVPAKSAAELIAYGKANPGKLTFSSGGVGTSIHLGGELFKMLTGVDMVHVAYRATSTALQDIMAGRVDLMFDNITNSLQHARAGSVRALGVTTPKRSAFAPELVPLAETVPGFDVNAWYGLFAPAKTPAELVEKISLDARAALADGEVRGRLETLAAEPMGTTPAEMGAHLRREIALWGGVIRQAGINPE